jgi:hypothetical protein
MQEPSDVHTILQEAESSAAAGFHAKAEQLLRTVAKLQESAFGPLHPELANTLNNLGIVCEMLDKPDDAEQCYRRAHSIAHATLEPDHPFIITSRKNLTDFCASRGRSLELPVASARVHADAIQLLTTSGHARIEVARQRRTTVMAIGLATALVLALAAVPLRRWWFSATPQESSAGVPTHSSQPLPAAHPPAADAPAPTVQSSSSGAVTGRSTPGSAPADRSPADESTRRPAAEPPGTAPSAPTSPPVAEARLCRTLEFDRSGGSSWRCDPLTALAGPGAVFFYTRLKFEKATTVEHRWYRGDQLAHVAKLRIQANPGSGYRTYSRMTVDTRSPQWRVELLSEDGSILHEEPFTVQ